MAHKSRARELPITSPIDRRRAAPRAAAMPRDRGFADAVRDRDQDKPCPWGIDIFILWPVQQPKRSSRPALGRARAALAAARGWRRERRSQPRLFLYLLVTQLLELADEVALAAVVDGADRGWDQRLKATARNAATRAPGAVRRACA